MEAGRRVFDREDVDVLWQVPVQGEPQAVVAQGRAGVEVGDEAPGRDAGIGAAAAVERDVLADDPPDGGFECALNRGESGLELPAGVGSAAELDCQPDIARASGSGRQRGSSACRRV
jgi:hypothetical protein